MLTKAQVSHIRSLQDKKGRVAANAFAIEGSRPVTEWLRSTASLRLLAATQKWILDHASLLAARPVPEVHEVSEAQLDQCSALRSPGGVILVADLPDTRLELLQPGLSTIVLDDVQDPGNVGTILRIADWFGIAQVLLSPGCADPYNPKVVQAGMGAHVRVSIFTAPLLPALALLRIPIVAATLRGSSVYTARQETPLALIIGNEGAGISPEILSIAERQVTIPRVGGAESLNAAVSAGILCSHLFGH